MAGFRLIKGYPVRDVLPPGFLTVEDGGRWVKAPSGNFDGAGLYWQTFGPFSPQRPWEEVQEQKQESPGYLLPPAYVAIAGPRPLPGEYDAHTWWQAANQGWEEDLERFGDQGRSEEVAAALAQVSGGIVAKHLGKYGLGWSMPWFSTRDGWLLRFTKFTQRPRNAKRQYLDYSLFQLLENLGIAISSLQIAALERGMDPSEGGFEKFPWVPVQLWPDFETGPHAPTG